MKTSVNRNEIYTSWLSTVAHIIAVPLFVFVFMIIYQPFGVRENLQMDSWSYSFNITMLFCILFCSILLTRILLRVFRRRIDEDIRLYLMWCIAEMVVASLFMSMYLSLMMQSHEHTFFDVSQKTLAVTFAISIYPYILLYFALGSFMRKRALDEAEDTASMVRFYDEYKKLKFIISSDAILYIKSDDNYVHVFYTENHKTRKQILRSSMRALEPVMQKHGMVRCHRSYFVNPAHIKMLGKDDSGALVCQLDNQGAESIPISRKYQDTIMNIL